MNLNNYGFIEMQKTSIVKSSDRTDIEMYSSGLEDYGFPYSAEHLTSMESQTIENLTNEYFALLYSSGIEAEEKKKGIFRKIWDWIVKKFNAIVNFFKGNKTKSITSNQPNDIENAIKKKVKTHSKNDGKESENILGIGLEHNLPRNIESYIAIRFYCISTEKVKKLNEEVYQVSKDLCRVLYEISNRICNKEPLDSIMDKLDSIETKTEKLIKFYQTHSLIDGTPNILHRLQVCLSIDDDNNIISVANGSKESTLKEYMRRVVNNLGNEDYYAKDGSDFERQNLEKNLSSILKDMNDYNMSTSDQAIIKNLSMYVNDVVKLLQVYSQRIIGAYNQLRSKDFKMEWIDEISESEFDTGLADFLRKYPTRGEDVS